MKRLAKIITANPALNFSQIQELMAGCSHLFISDSSVLAKTRSKRFNIFDVAADLDPDSFPERVPNRVCMAAVELPVVNDAGDDCATCLELTAGGVVFTGLWDCLLSADEIWHLVIRACDLLGLTLQQTENPFSVQYSKAA
ncbi:MAG: hypothetical protein M0036_14240 [Desulfobacteraceae bacterium]|nr:hypothetical protein [Desulfobacteraceae bacterium]